MSFSKARIQRFNELSSEAPPPGAYDPKFESKVKGLFLEKTERFPDNKSVCSNTDSYVSSCSKAHSCASTSKFKNPLPPKSKRAIVKSLAKGALKSPSSQSRHSKENKAQYDIQNELSDLKVECANKSKTIEEYEDQILQVKAELLSLKSILEEQAQRDMNAEEQHRKDIEAMAKLQQQVLDNREEKYKSEVELLRLQLEEVTMMKEEELQAQKNEWKDKMDALEFEFSDSKREMEKLLNEKIDIANFIKLQMEVENGSQDLDVNELKKQKKNLGLRIGGLEQCLISETTIFPMVNEFLALYLELKSKYVVLRSEHEDSVECLKQDILNLGDFYDEELGTIRDEFLQEKEVIEEKLEMEIAAKRELEIKLESLLLKNFSIMKHLQEVRKMKDSFEHVKSEIKELNNARLKELGELKEEVAILNSIHEESKAKMEKELQIYLEENEKLKNMYTVREGELVDVKKSMSKKIDDVKKHAEKMVENAEAVTRETLAACRSESEEKVKKIITETDSKVNEMVQEARDTVNKEMRSSADRYTACLERVKAERTTLDEKLAQRDAKITWLSAALEELKATAETQESFSQSLQDELDRVEMELVERKEELRALKDQIRTESAEMVARKRRFEVVMAENQASVNALVERLAQSDLEVERLQHELKCGEACVKEHRDLLNVMRNSSNLVNEQVYALMGQLDSERGIIDQLEVNNLADIESIRLLFEAKIDNLKQTTGKEVTRLTEECEKKSNENAELKQQLEKMSEKLKEAQKMLLQLEEKCDDYTVEVARMEMAKEKKEQLLKKQDEIIKSNKLLLEAQADYNEKIQQADDKIRTLTECVEKIKLSEANLQKQLDDFKHEKSEWEKQSSAMRENLEKERSAKSELVNEVKILSETCERFQKEYEEISEKYSEILGHHNNKQKVKHISQLKEKICSQQGEILRLKQELELKSKSIEHLSKSGEKRGQNKGKENAPRIPPKISATTTHTSTPLVKNSNASVLSSSPLRNRNE